MFPLRWAQASLRRLALVRLVAALALASFGTDSSEFRLRGHLARLEARGRMSQESEQILGAAAVVVETGRPVVTGGHLKKAWAPEPVLDAEVLEDGLQLPAKYHGMFFVALSSNDYFLGQFLFGKANGPGGRNLPRTTVVNRIWSARNAAQEEALAVLKKEEEEVAQGDESVLQDMFPGVGGEPAAGPGPGRSKKPKQHVEVEVHKRLRELPRTFQVSLPSQQEGKATVEFVVARALPESCPAILISQQSLQTLLEECAAELPAEKAGRADVGVMTPPRRKRRRQSPLVPSPGESSPTARANAKKRKTKSAQTHHDKKTKQVVAKWAGQDGGIKCRRFPLTDAPGGLEAVQTQALNHAKGRHCKK